MIFVKVFQKMIPALFTLCWFSLSSKKSLLLLLVVSFFTFTCDEEKPVPTTGDITGRVTDKKTEESLSGVKVVLNPQVSTINPKNITTQNEGNYEFQDEDVGNYTLTFSKSGYEEGTAKVTVEGGKIRNTDIALEPVIPVATLTIRDDDTLLDFGTESSSRSFTISNNGEDGSILNFEITKEGGDWLTISPLSGSITKNADSSPKRITVTVDRDTIEFDGQMATAEITVDANGSVTNKTITVKVGKKINLVITPQKIEFDCEDAENSIITKTFTLENLSNSNLTYTILVLPDWISVDTKKLTGVVSSRPVTIEMMVNTDDVSEDMDALIDIEYVKDNKFTPTSITITYIAPQELSVMTGPGEEIMVNKNRTQATIVSTITNIRCHDISHYGHFWSTANPPDPNNSETEKEEKDIGSLPKNGMFTSKLTELRLNTNYYVMAYVRYRDENLIMGSVDSFNTTNHPPTAPVLIDPANRDTSVILSPTLTWESSTDLDGDNITYDVFLGTSRNLTNPPDNTGNQRRYVVTPALNLNTIYYWKVVARDGQGNKTPSDSVYQFTTEKPISVISLSLSNLNFGSINIDERSTETLTIRNTGDKSFNVTGINFSSSPSTFSGNYSGTITAGSTKEITITFQPTSAETYTETITVLNNADNGKNTIDVIGTGRSAAEPTTGTITGKVTDRETDEPLSNVLVVLRTGGITDLATITTPNNGNYAFQDVAVGNYTLIFSKSGYRESIKDITVERGRTINADITLDPAVSTLTIRDDDTLDFGTESGSRVFTISNDGEEGSILNFEIIKTEDWLTLSPTSGSITKNSDGLPKLITVTVDRDMIEFTEQTATTNIIINANGSVNSKIITVKVRQRINLVISTISLSLSSTDFGNVDLYNTSTRILTIENIGDKSFNVVGINFSSSPSAFSGDYLGTIDAGYFVPVEITFFPTSAGNYFETITVNNDADNRNDNTISVSGTGVDNSMSTISLSPSDSIDFGNVDLNNTSTETLSIRNDGDKTFNVTSIISSSSAFSGNYSGTVTAGNTQRVTIIFRPTSARTYDETITVNNNADNGNNTISVSGRGVDNSMSTISLSPSSIDFGSVDLYNTSTRILTIRNTGDKSFDVTNITSSSRFSVSSNSSGTIDAGRSRTVEITFRPTSERTYNETITVNNDADNGNNTISVSGTGRSAGAPNLVFVEYEIDDDNSSGSSGDDDGVAETGETIELDVRLRNSGDATATNVDATLSTTDGGINITDDDVTFGDISSGSNDTGSDFDFEIASGGSSRNVTFTLRITSDEGSWTTTFSIPIQAPSTPITPSDRCSSSAPTLDVDTEYEIEINEVNLESYKLEASIQSYSNNNDSVRSFWFKVNVPSGGAMVKIYKVGVAFDPVIGFKQLFCPSDLNDYLEIGTSMKKYLDLGSAEEDESYTLTSSGVYNMRIYDYNNTSSTISFKIIVESR